MKSSSSSSSSRLLREIHRETTHFLKGRLPEVLPSYVPPATREASLRAEVEALRSQLPPPLGSRSSKRSRLAAALGDGGDNGEEPEQGPRGGSSSEILRLRAELEDVRLARERDSQRHAIMLEEADNIKAKLERQVRFLMEEEKAVQADLKAKQKEWVEERLDFQSRLREEQKRSHNLEEQLLNGGKYGHVQETSNATTDHPQDMILLDSENKRLKLEITALRGDLKRICSAREEEEADSKKWEKRRAENNTRLSADALEEDAAVNSEDARKLRTRIRELERLLRRREQTIEEMGSDIKTLKRADSEASSLRHKVSMLEKEVKELCVAAESHSAIMEQKEQWASMFRKLVTASSIKLESNDLSPLAALQLLKRAQEESVAYASRASQWEARASNLADRLKIARNEVMTESSRRALAEEQAEEQRAKSERDSRRAKTLERELKAANEMIEALESVPHSKSVDGKPPAREQNLASALEATKAELAALREEAACATPQAVLAKCRSRNCELEVSLERAEQEKAAAERERDSIMKQLEKVERELSKYEHQVVTGDYDRRITKVLHFVNNPTAIALAKASKNKAANEMERLQFDNNKLMQEVEVLRAGATDAVKAAAEAAAKARAEGIDKDKVNQRLKEMFKERIQSFREAVYLLTGFKIDMTNDRDSPQLRLRSMYADSEEDHILFQWEQDGLQLMETPFASRLETKIFTYLSTCNSVPAFLSNLTLELFEKQTWQGP